jgi:hypothetical protein
MMLMTSRLASSAYFSTTLAMLMLMHAAFLCTKPACFFTDLQVLKSYL